MPKRHEYFGLIVMFYSNEHEPVHVHGKFQGRESRAEILVINGEVIEIRYSDMSGRQPAPILFEMRYFEEVVSSRADEIVAKWIDYFVLNKSIAPERITRRLGNELQNNQCGECRIEKRAIIDLNIEFDDGVKQLVDFQPFLAHSRHPEIRAWLQPEKFAAFRIEFGELVWGDL